VETLLQTIQDWFGNKTEHLTVFASSDCRLEGWFKGELLVLFRRLREAGTITEFDREVNVLSKAGKRLQVDFEIRVATDLHICEIKALCISQAAGTPRNLAFYFRDDHVGLIKDMRKLELVSDKKKWLLAFIYPAPSLAAWESTTRCSCRFGAVPRPLVPYERD
jgi:hypothetical protein